jgi:UMF1 family MFS transporter
MPGLFGGISGGLASRLSFVATGLWWAGFAQITFYALPNPMAIGKGVQAGITKGIKTLRHTFKTVVRMPEAGRYLGTYFIYNMGVQTIMYLATLFASKELNLPQQGLIGTMLLLQLIAIPGAIACARLAERFGRYKVLASLAFLWMLVCIAAFGVQTATQFYALAAVVGVGMGGIQSLSRATWSGLLPGGEHGHASYFGVFDFVDKVSIVCGTLVFGLISQVTGSMRLSALTLATFFLIGFILLIGLQKSHGKATIFKTGAL